MTIITRTIYKMRVEQIVDHTHNVRELILKPVEPEEFKFRSGQFVMLHVPTESGKPALRAYSIASSDKINNGFHLLFKFIENGVASQFVWALKGEEVLSFTGPFGKLFFTEPPTEQIYFLSTGTGLSQHLCYMLSNQEKYSNLKYRMLLGCRNEKDIYHQDVLEKLKKLFPHFEYEFILSQASPAWSGKKGYLQEHLPIDDLLKTPTTIYMCGNGSMIKETKALLEAKGFDKTKVWAEAFD